MFYWSAYKAEVAQPPRCCAITQAGHHCRNQPEEWPKENGRRPFPTFLRFCSLHESRYLLYRREWEREQSSRLTDLRIARQRKEEDARARWATVYYVRRADGLIKIGYTGKELRVRLSALRREHGPLEVLATHRGGYVAEQANHRRFAALRVTGEWFRPEPALLAHIDHINARHAVAPCPKGAI